MGMVLSLPMVLFGLWALATPGRGRARRGMTPLGDKIAALIRAAGPISVADYMALCLSDPEARLLHGDPRAFRPRGRFHHRAGSQPDVRRAGRRLAGRGMARLRPAACRGDRRDRPRPRHADEGHGRTLGQLDAGLARRRRLRPRRDQPASAAVQQREPRAQRAALSWHDRGSTRCRPAAASSSPTSSSTPCPSANSSRRRRMAANGRRPRRRRRLPSRPASLARRPPCCPPTPPPRLTAASSRSRPPAEALMSASPTRMAEHGGAGLFVDYGHLGPASATRCRRCADTLREDPLANPGEADLTAHVDFAALGAASPAARPRSPHDDAGRVPARPWACSNAPAGSALRRRRRAATNRRPMSSASPGPTRWESCSRCWPSPPPASAAGLPPSGLTSGTALPHCPPPNQRRSASARRCTKSVRRNDKTAMLDRDQDRIPLRSPLLDTARVSRHPARLLHARRRRLGRHLCRLNIGIGSADDPTAVAENRRRVAAWMGVPAEALLSVHQVHSPDVIVSREPFRGAAPEGRRLVTDRPGLAIGASAADCGPVLFADPQPASSAPPMPAGKAPSPACWRTRSRRWKASAPAAKTSWRCSVLRSARPTTRSALNSSTASSAADAANDRYFAPLRDGPATPCSISTPTPSTACRRPASRPTPRPLHLCGGGAVLFLSPRHAPQRSRTTAGRFRPSSWRPTDGPAFRPRRIRRAPRPADDRDGRARSSTPCCSSPRRACTG